MKESDDWMVKIIYFDERELLITREINTKVPKKTEVKVTKVLSKFVLFSSRILYIKQY